MAEREAILKEVFALLLSHKEYQRRWRGGMQILFGFTPDELDMLRAGKMPDIKRGEHNGI